ncbi:MAG: tetratricopeptide repeat protein [Drouetiella hepatica Uher 2000/2452]|jgi:tetratricopeptide (TPR) repeat protein|uniref:Tetratricopeptide repeat protein n=1 Tax=Drouetiella hepatica Uher 2000/2452 TaxID=904376 RepID=A0A951Q6A8_9CYAN|nr:tetratricopeptide repeat protein [Drouetiella hepatica Uher 2000/2452]
MVRQPLDGLQGADLQKKCDRLSALQPPPRQSDTAAAEIEVILNWQAQAKLLADGNPRLLETLNDRVQPQPQTDRAATLKQLAANPTELRQQVIEARLLQQIPDELRTVLSRGLVFDLPVPPAAFASVTAGGEWIDRAIALGLLEVSPDQTLRVPRILPLSLPQEAEPLYELAAQTLYECWRQCANATEAQDLEVHRLAMLARNGEIAAELGATLGHRWHSQSRFREAVALGEKTVALTADYRIHHSLARSQATLGAVASALENYQKALATCSEADQKEKFAILHNSAGIYAQQGQVKEAIALYQQSLALKESIGDVQGKAASLHQIAIVYAQQGQVNEAIGLHQESLALYESIGNVKGKAASLHCMAIIYTQQGQVKEAIALYQQSLALYESIGNVQGKAASLHQIADIYAQQGQVEEATELYQQSLALDESIGDVKGKAASLHQMAGIYAQQGQVEEAIELYQQSLALDESIGNVQGKAASLHCMAGIYAQQGQVEEAIALYQQSLALEESIGNVQGKAASLHCMAGIYAQQGQVKEAIELFKESLEIEEKIGHVHGKAMTLWWLGHLANQQSNPSLALPYLQEAFEILQHLRSPNAAQVEALLQAVQQQLQ